MNKEGGAEHLLISTATILSHSVSGQLLHLEKNQPGCAVLCPTWPWGASNSSFWEGLALWKVAFKDRNDKAHLSFIPQCGHRELDRAERQIGGFYTSPRVTWSPSQPVSIENPLYFSEALGEIRSPRVATGCGRRDTTCLTYRSCSMKSLSLIAEFWYLKPAQCCSDSQTCCLVQTFLASYLHLLWAKNWKLVSPSGDSVE